MCEQDLITIRNLFCIRNKTENNLMARKIRRARKVVLKNLTPVARSDDLSLAQQYAHMLMKNDIDAVITEGGPAAGIFKYLIKVTERFYDKAFLLIENENTRDPYFLDPPQDQQLKTG